MKNKMIVAGVAWSLFLTLTSGAFAAQVKVLGIDTSTNWDYNTVNSLVNVAFTEVSAGDFGSVDLNQYDVLLVSETFKNGSVTVPAQDTLDALALRETDIESWLDAGHGIVAWSEPIGLNAWDWLPDSIDPGNAGLVHDDEVFIQDFTHPVMAGLTSEGLSGWSTSAHNSFAAIPAGWDVLVTGDATGGTAITIAGAYGNGRVVLSSQDPDFHSFYGIHKPDQFVLAQNAIDWVAGSSATVPEPASVFLFGAGLAGLAMTSRKRRK